MNPKVPRVAAVHDISCFGRCSLTVIMPILSCLGIQVCPLPTAILSTHLGGFKNVAFCDFTDRMPEFFHHWQQEGLAFDCIYSGFLASEEQIDVVSRFIDMFAGNNPLVLVDPVMGDEGKLYSVYTPKMQAHMQTLVRKADIITPNYTEACFLLGERYQDDRPDVDKLKQWLVRLADFGPAKVVMTGIPFVGEKIANMAYDRLEHSFYEVSSEYIRGQYPGTGDVFASVLAGSLLNGFSLPAAMKRAADFVALGIRTTFAAGTPAREGILLERALPWLCRNI
ncbi:MAG TPA: pyridoxamine kinase [Methylomusa anaerophila]|uniref:pyridoxal kinase n=1 Tax=Methylomusa anaerophila TaxID=1930071 RepID=A0A348AG67_9FIRM|nr:pyridoxamine kinase [Methylomusa anaerophila]BBB90065.1 pyridoxine kinase [Methylomusa anaerophila]HML88209.1 pyridoxamine kinase [Methylomusa anaerophila]